jgi:hypothetical protein
VPCPLVLRNVLAVCQQFGGVCPHGKALSADARPAWVLAKCAHAPALLGVAPLAGVVLCM